MADYETGSILSQPMFSDVLGLSSTFLDDIIKYLVFRNNDWSLDKSKYKQVPTLIQHGFEEDIFAYETKAYLIFWQMNQSELITSIKAYEHDKTLSQKLTALYHGLNVRVFKNADIQTTIVVCDSVINVQNVEGISIMAASMPLLMPWLKIYDEDKPIFKAIYERRFEETREWFNKVPQSAIEEAHTLHVKALLNGVKNAGKERQRKNMTKQYESLMREIEGYRDLIVDKQYELNEINRQLMALDLLPDEQDNVSEFFIQHAAIVELLRVNRTEKIMIEYSVTTPIQFYDEDALRRIMDSSSSWYNTSCQKWHRQLIKDIFINNKVQLMASATFVLNEFADIIPKTFTHNPKTPSIPNPHIYYYGCLGGNQQYFNQYAKSGEWELAIEQSIGCTANLNFCDYSVMNKFICSLVDQKQQGIKVLRYKGEEMDIDTYLAMTALD